MQLLNKFLSRPIICLSVLVFFAFAIRLLTIYHGISAHPDERHIIMSVMNMNWGWNEMNPGSFAYGSVPFYLLFFVKEFLRKLGFAIGYDQLFLVGRSLSALVGSCTLLVLFHLANKMFDSLKWSLLPCVLLFFNWFFFQNSRFYTVDIFLTFFALISILKFMDFIQIPSAKNFFLMVTFFALSFSCKVSALSLGVFITATPMILYLQKKISLRNVAMYFILFSILSLLLMACLQPHAFVNFSHFFSDVMRESSMVRGDYVPPYTLQYVGTMAYFYPLKQMAIYTIGPLVFLLLFLGVLELIKNYKLKENLGMYLFFFWMLATFLVVGAFQVKFPRYLLPIYPGLMIVASLGIQYLVSWIKKRKLKLSLKRIFYVLIFALTLLQPALYFLSYLNILSEEHSSITASLWMKQNISRDELVLQPHWDDWLPTSIPLDFHFKVEEFPIYDAREVNNWGHLSAKLAASDYLIFPTQKIFDSYVSTGDEDKLPKNFILKLFSGDLGHSLVKSIKAEFRFLFFKLDFQSADESLSVYDAPKISIFKNQKKLDADVIKDLVTNKFHSTEKYSELLRKEVNVSHFPQTINWIILWMAILYLLQFISLPLISFFLKSLPDQGYSINKILGPTFFCYLAWLLVRINLLSFNRTSLWMLILAFTILSFIFVALKKFSYREFLSKNRPHIISIEILSLLIFGIFCILRMGFPEIFWSEKPMDFTFLNYFIRATDSPLPPQDPWAAGSLMKYYYFSSFFLATIHKLIQLPSTIGFNLSLILIPSFLGVAGYGFLINFTKKRLYAVVGAMVPIFYCNVQSIKEAFFDKRDLDFHLFWRTSRLLSEPGFVEFPLWSFLFSDVHAHVFALPYTIIFITLIFHFWKDAIAVPLKIHFRLTFITAFSWSCLALINGWDFIFYSFLVAFLAIFSFFAFEQSSLKKSLFFIGKFVILELIVVAFILLYLKDLSGPNKTHLFIQNNLNELNSISQMLKHYGLIWISLMGGLFLLVYRRIKFLNSQFYSTLAFVLFLPFLLLLVIYFNHSLSSMNWGIFSLAIFLLFVLSTALSLYSKSWTIIFVLLATAYSSLSIFFWEQVVFIDRMNSIFKFHYPIWMLTMFCTLAIILSSSFSLQNESIKKMNSFMKRYRITFFYLPLTVSLIAASIDIGIMFKHNWRPPLKTTLDGLDYLRLDNPDEYDFINWINQNIKGVHVIAEAHGTSYADYNRISMHTGLPTVLGWWHHVYQRGLSNEDANQRLLDLKNLYGHGDDLVKRSIIDKYRIDYVVIGLVEQRTYGEGLINEFLHKEKLFQIIYKNKHYAIAKVVK
ncbi:MAG: DUF2298 domain-containing protein [Bacteriovoracaceae bacterium]|nr:DUF2298 domain-containing protein [Bacteriovoracaceae bacterium]